MGGRKKIGLILGVCPDTTYTNSVNWSLREGKKAPPTYFPLILSSRLINGIPITTPKAALAGLFRRNIDRNHIIKSDRRKTLRTHNQIYFNTKI